MGFESRTNERGLIQELIIYEFELDYNAAVEATKNICFAKDEGRVVPSTVTRWLKKFCSDCKKLDNKARSDRPKTVDSEAVLQAIETNPVCNTWSVSGEFSIS